MRPTATGGYARRGRPANRAGGAMSCVGNRRTVLHAPRILAALLSLIVLVFGAASIAGAQTILYVDLDAAGADNGTSWGDAFTDLQNALAASFGGGYEIWVAEGTYTPGVQAGRDATFQLLNGVALYGGFAGTEDDRADRDWVLHETILSGDLNGDDDVDAFGSPIHRSDNSYHVVTGSGTDATAVVDGFTIRGGNRGPAAGTAQVRGAGMYNAAGSPTVAHCTLSDNHATWGGGMYNENGSDPTVIDCRFSGSMVNCGGGMYNVDSDPTVTDCTFSDNVAGGSGGGMYNEASDPTVTGCVFLTNHGHGGGMFNTDSNPTVSSCTFSGNWGVTGGGMCNEAASHPTITGCTFSGSHAAVNGGGMYNKDSNPTVTGCTFEENIAYENGGGMYSSGGAPTLTDCVFSKNSGEFGKGGGMYSTASSLSVAGGTFTENWADQAGGGMYSTGSDLTVADCDFTSNWVGATGGGGMCNVSCTGTVSACTFSYNEATSGGGMYNDGSDPAVTLCTFSRNTANYSGGGMCNESNSSPTVTESSFSGNTAWRGGGMHNLESSPVVTGCTFSGNSAQGVGALVTSSAGGGMCNEDCTNLTVTSCTFSGNSAGYYGGGMYNLGSSSAVANCTFSGNSAGDHGGGMYNQASNPIVTHCTFFGNGANGIHNNTSTPVVKNTILTGNTPADCNGFVTSDGYNLESGTSCGCTEPTDRQNTDPLLGPLADNGGPTWTHALLPGSPALDTIPWPGAPTTDQRGFPRPYPVGGLADIGAVEVQQAHGKGDINGDGSIDLLDVVLCQQLVSGLVRGTAAQHAAADVDRDGDVDEDDVRILAEYVLGIRNTLP